MGYSKFYYELLDLKKVVFFCLFQCDTLYWVWALEQLACVLCQLDFFN
jgi:hypothetical protein